jgi:hypothetical protein
MFADLAAMCMTRQTAIQTTALTREQVSKTFLMTGAAPFAALQKTILKKNKN